jgi:TIR domain/Pentapeptide repeats (8 copies)
MNRRRALRLLRGKEQGISEWNRRRGSGEEIPDLHGAELAGASLRNADLSKATLSGANLFNADLGQAKLVEADLRGALLFQADFFSADLRGSNLSKANLKGAKFHIADLRGSILRDSELFRVDFIAAQLSGADFRGTHCGTTAFSAVDLSEAVGLAEVIHEGPSNVDIATIFKSGNKIPKAFLLGCGIPDFFLDQLPSLADSDQRTQFYSCFISYSGKDHEFAKRLHSKMRDHGLRVWFAAEDVKAGKILDQQIDEAIRLYEKLLLVLTQDSMNSEWVKTEIRKARKAERKENRRKLFPIRLVEFDAVRDWECFDADSGKDLALEIREYFIPDFSNWKENDSFEVGWKRLLNDLKADEATGTGAHAPPATSPETPR